MFRRSFGTTDLFTVTCSRNFWGLTLATRVHATSFSRFGLTPTEGTVKCLERALLCAHQAAFAAIVQFDHNSDETACVAPRHLPPQKIKSINKNNLRLNYQRRIKPSHTFRPPATTFAQKRAFIRGTEVRRKTLEAARAKTKEVKRSTSERDQVAAAGSVRPNAAPVVRAAPAEPKLERSSRACVCVSGCVCLFTFF